MAYHAGIAAAPGGFLGVDVFFVLSGFLITGLLADEARRTGTVSLATFWARREAGMIGVLPGELPSKANPPEGVKVPNSPVP